MATFKNKYNRYMRNMHVGGFSMSSLCSTLPPQINISFACACSVIDNVFRHNIVKVAVGTRGDGRVDPKNTLTML